MSRNSKKYMILFIILVFSFLYRLIIMLAAKFPPGADIGVHNELVHSITGSGNASFLWNNYQMGGEMSLEFPSYHIFIAQVVFFTGLPDYLAHVLVAALFSTLIVACAFLITRRMWTESAALIVAFLAAFSHFDFEMLMWSGYPNVVSLMLIPLIFYLFFEYKRFTLPTFVLSESILVGALLITHSLSALVFLGIVVAFGVSAAAFSKKLAIPKKGAILVPIILGGLVVSPILIKAVPVYLGPNLKTFTGGVPDIMLAVLSKAILPWELLLSVAASAVPFFLFSRAYKSKFLTPSALLMALWILVPVALTQSYIVGFYYYYVRFLYFAMLPVIILLGLMIDSATIFFLQVSNKLSPFRRGKWQFQKAERQHANFLKRQILYTGVVLISLLLAFSIPRLLLAPSEAIQMHNFYQQMNPSGYDAIQWAKQNTPTNAVFASDAQYGWWLGGFAQRPILSDIDPEGSTVASEVEPAKAVRLLLDTDYEVDNGLIQVREDGGYIARHNPEILAKLNSTYSPYPFFDFNTNQTRIEYKVSGISQFVYSNQLPVKVMDVESDTEHATIIVEKGDEFINYTQYTTIYRGLSFVNITVTVGSTVSDVSLDCVHITVQSKGIEIPYGNNRTIALIDEGMKVFGQIIFDKEQPAIERIQSENPCLISLQYDLQKTVQGEFQISAAAYSSSNSIKIYQTRESEGDYFNKIIYENLNSSQKPISDRFLDVFDYQNAVKDWRISYIALRDSELIPKFAKDPAFNLIFDNKAVVVFMAKSGFSEYGRPPLS